MDNIPLEYNEIPSSDNGHLDSYGNPVTPFGELQGPINLDPQGFVPPLEAHNAQNNRWNFKVPSYASGIIDTIPHVPSLGRSISFGDFSTSTLAPEIPVTPEQFQFLNRFVPEEKGGPILFAEKPSEGLLPPVFGEAPVTTIAPPSHHAPPTFRPVSSTSHPGVFFPTVTPAPFAGSFASNQPNFQYSSTEATKYYTTAEPRIGQSGMI
jgi:hypothetical protein